MSEPVKDLSVLSREQKLALLARLARQKERAARSFPLSFAQQRLWFLDRLEPGSHAHTIFRAVTWSGPLRVEALRRALAEVVRRHEALRTVFPEVDGEPRQRVVSAGGPAADLPLPVEDLSHLPEEERGRRAREAAAQEARRPFNLAVGPVFRARLLRLAQREHVLLLALHHIAADGWSLGIVFREMTALYRAFSAGLPSPLPEPELQFPDFALWQRERLAGERLEGELAWWRERLAGFPGMLELPTDRPRPAAGSYRGAIHGFKVPPGTSQALRALARREGCTPFILLLAAFEVLLFRASEQARFLVGTNVAGRQRTELEGVVGFFAETLLLRASLDRGSTFRELLSRVRQDTLDAQVHQELPFERLVEDLQPERHLSHHPLFQVSMVLQNAPGGAVDLPAVTLGSLPVERGLAKLDLTLEMSERDGAFAGYFEYNTDLFEPETAARLAGRFLRLLEAVAAEPDGRIGELPLLTAEEVQRLEGWSAGPTPPRTPLPVHRAFEESARRGPTADAVVLGGERLSYAELDGRANRLARCLRRLGVGPETRVGLLLERSLHLPVALLAVLKAGGTYVPLEPGHPPDRLALLAEDSGLRVLLTQEALAGRAPAAPAVLLLDAPAGERPWEAEPAEPPAPEAVEAGEVHPESAAYVIYTSGSTGRPKGVAVSHRALANHAAAIAARYGIEPRDRVQQFAALSFDIAGEEIFPTWLAGAALVLRPAGLFPSFPELERRIAEAGITVANLPTVYWHEWTAELARAGAAPPAPLRLVVVGTEQASAARLAQWRELAGVRVSWINAYGPTEATISATVHEPGAETAGAPRVPIGRPIAGVRALVLDGGLQPVPPGAVGELCLGGAGVARGYLHDPARTAAAFVPDPSSRQPGARLYRTGDRARFLPCGEIELLGRGDDQVKIRGYRIEPGEVEAALARHPEVDACAVLAEDDGGGGRRLVAYAAVAPGRALAAEELRAFLRGLLPEHMVPAAFALLPALPLNASGKVDRGALARSAPPQQAAPAAGEAPQTPTQELVAAVWAELLRRDRVGLRESFFDLGGHSLLAIQAVSRLRDVLGVEVPLRAVFEDPTVAGVAAAAEAAALHAGQGTTAPPVLPVPRDRPLPCSFSQQRLWLLDRLLPGNPAYNLPVAVRFQGAMSLAVLGLALQEMVRRHESLRTTFAVGPDGQPVQVVAPQPAASALPAVPPVVDLRRLPAAAAPGEAFARLVDDSVRPLDLTRGPLVRFVLFRLGEDDLLLYFVIHHIISDGVSITLLQRELLAVYGALSRGAAPPLPPLRVQYADFAAWQRSWLQGEALERQLAYWRRQLEGAPVVIDLPTDRPRPPVQTSHGARVFFDLPARRVREVAALGRRERCTLFMVLQGVLNALLGRYTGQDDVLVGWPIAGRSRAELEGVVGYLANLLVLRTDLRGEPSFRQLLARVREASLGAYAHQDLPFEQLVEELRPERHLSHNPVFQVFFVLNHASGGALALPGVQVTVPSIDNRTTRGDLLVGFSERLDGGFSGLLEYNTDLFDAATAERLSRSFLQLLEAALARPDEPFDLLPLFDAEERRQIVEGWNDTAAPFPDLCVHQLFEAQAARAPTATALVFDVDGERLTYGQLDARAGRLARRLREAGVRPGVLAGVCLERSPEMVVALLAVLKSGGAYVPLDPAYPPERLAFVLEDSGARVLLTQPELVYDLPAGGLEVIAVEPGDPVPLEPTEEGDDLEPLAGPADLAYVIYTSGSTGRPKGVAVTHAGVVNFLVTMARRPGLAAGDALLAVTTISFDIAGLELYLPLAMGAKVVLAGRDTSADGALLARALEASGATVMQATPATWRLLLAAGWTGRPGLRVLCGGEALPVDLAAELRPRVGELWNVYGPTETTIWSTVEPVAEAAGTGGAVSIGRPIANTTAHLLDRRLEPVPVGVAGELYLGGAGVARGYLGRPDLTAERFVPDPFSGRPGGRLYRTGDLARRLHDGRLSYVGRTDFQVKVRGFRIELGEIEAVLSRHPGVVQSVVAVREEDPGNPRLVAFYVAAGGQPVSVGNLRAALREELPDYMIPALFVALPELPLTPNGKVDRKALPEPEGGPDVGREHVPPEGPVQEKLAAIWAEVLRAGRVGARDSFFELGGHSLLATQVLTRVQETFGVELPLRAMFDNPTVAALAEVVIQKELERADADLLAKLLAELEGGPAGGGPQGAA